MAKQATNLNFSINNMLKSIRAFENLIDDMK
jgi:hypothetical protein